MKHLYLLFVLIFALKLSAQDYRTIILGKVLNNSVPIENVHIINKTSKRGTLSNKNGDFKIFVREKDTLTFSDIQFKSKIIIIDKNHIKNKKINIKLFQKNNELPEVVIENMAKSLGLPNASKKPLNKLERNLNAYSQESLPIVILATLLGQQGGIDDIYNIISGHRKRDRKLKKLIDDDKKHKVTQENIQIIRVHFKDDFFIDTIQIKKDYIDSFINFCVPKGIEELYKKERFLEVMDIFIKNKEDFLLIVKQTD